MNKIKILLGASALLFSSLIHASIISIDDPVFGIDSVTQDSESGLDWLDVTLSINRSFLDVNSQFGIGGDYEGWRYANTSDFTQLWHNILGNNPTGLTHTIHASSSSDLLPWIQVFGDTSTNENFWLNASYTIGFLDSAPGYTSRPYSAAVYIDDTYSQHFTDATYGWYYGDNHYSTVGSWLVRETSPVPIPAAVWLFGSGLIGLIGMASRKVHV